MLTLGAFLVAIAVLVAVHEWGHFAMARVCGVKVLGFSIGFGPRLVGWTSARSGTEYRLGLLPLGGYVKMLDEREGPVAAQELARAFNRQRLRSRALIVAAGPVANLLLAVLLYSGVNWVGVQEPQARIARPDEGTYAQQAGLRGGEWVIAAGAADAPLRPVQSFDDLRWLVGQAAMNNQQLVLRFRTDEAGSTQQAVLDFTNLDMRQMDAAALAKLGFDAPYSSPRIGALLAGGAALSAGLQPGDLVRGVDDIAITDAAQLRALIRRSGEDREPSVQRWQVERKGSLLVIEVTPRRAVVDAQRVGRVGAMIGAAPAMVTLRYGLREGVQRAVVKTWDVSGLTLRMMWQIATGSASYKNLSGPITIADYAGRSAALGFGQFVVFLALVSISLGVLNLLPVPVLDGGHLMYYLWEGVTGRPVAQAWMSRLQRAGVALLLCMMSIAIFNDISRLLF